MIVMRSQKQALAFTWLVLCCAKLNGEFTQLEKVQIGNDYQTVKFHCIRNPQAPWDSDSSPARCPVCQEYFWHLEIYISEGAHSIEEDINKQINDKERVAAAMENPSLREIVDQCVLDPD